MGPPANLRNTLSPSWRLNKAYFVGLAMYSAVCVIVAWVFGFNISISLYAKSLIVVGMAACVFLFAFVSFKTAIRKPDHLIREIFYAIRVKHNFFERIVIGVPVLISFPIFFSEFTSMKMNISNIVPFYADHALIDLERAILGVDAWEVVQPIFGFPFLTFFLNFFYSLWALVLVTVLLIVAFSLEDTYRSRERFLLSYVMLWGVLGGVAATLGASVGPVYVDHFYGDTGFAPLFAYLEEANRSYPIWALQTQAWLLERSSANGPTAGSGISAFPSMHVAVATLYPLYCWHRGRLLRIGSLAFLCLIFIGSIHLGWHYAVDGAFSIAVTVLIWRFTAVLMPSAISPRSERFTAQPVLRDLP